ncbi:MAG: hypothetical protein PF590_08920 [Candidatus Delongbacteria bacterium]|jgi:hypothetical protein|nr:hypothetical protein [Candidatus Delongbacteria bacterium]
MIKHITQIAVTTAICLVLMSCDSAYYVPDSPHVPLLSNKGEVQASFQVGTAGSEIKTTWAITEHSAVMLNGVYAKSFGGALQTRIFAEAGYGYFYPLSDWFRLEAFSGVGYGIVDFYPFHEHQNFYSDPWDPHYDIHQYRGFVQPAIGIVTPFIDNGLAARISVLDHHQPGLNVANLFVTPVLVSRKGYKWVRLSFKLGYSFKFGPLTDTRSIYARPWVFSYGIQVNLNRLYNEF